MQALGVPPAEHQSASEFIHNDNLSGSPIILNHIVTLSRVFKGPECILQTLVNVGIKGMAVAVGVINAGGFDQTIFPQHPIHLRQASFRKAGFTGLLINDVVLILPEGRNQHS